MTQAELDIQVTNAQCCAANIASKLVGYIQSGDIHADCFKLKFLALMNLINSVLDYDMESECLSTEEVSKIVVRINKLCSECC